MFFYVSINKNGTQGAGLKGPVWRLYNSNILKDENGPTKE